LGVIIKLKDIMKKLKLPNNRTWVNIEVGQVPVGYHTDPDLMSVNWMSTVLDLYLDENGFKAEIKGCYEILSPATDPKYDDFVIPIVKNTLPVELYGSIDVGSESDPIVSKVELWPDRIEVWVR
jgi:hypothetical protein